MTTHEYSAVEDYFRNYSGESKKLAISPGECSARFHELFKESGFELAEKDDVIALIKAKKNPVM